MQTSQASRSPKPARLGWRFGLLGLLPVLVLVALVAGCQPASPTPSPPPIPTVTPSPTPPPEAARPLPRPSATPTLKVEVSPTPPRPAPILYAMNDSRNTDWRQVNPAYGPVGSHIRFFWEQVNPARGVFDWSRVDAYLQAASQQRVRLRSGEEVPKPVLLAVGIYSAWAPGWDYNHYDHAPQWLYQDMGRPQLGGRYVGYLLEPEGCTPTSAPMYDDPAYQEAFRAMVLALGQRYNRDPRVSAVLIANGIDDESRAIVSKACKQYDEALASYVTPQEYDEFVLKSIDWYRQAFPDKPVFLQPAAAIWQARKRYVDYAVSRTPPVGIKMNGLAPDEGSWFGYKSLAGMGMMDLVDAYRDQTLIAFEPKLYYPLDEFAYWTLLAGLAHWPDFIDVQAAPDGGSGFLRHLPNVPGLAQFVEENLGTRVETASQVWIVLRDTELPKELYNGFGSGEYGDWDRGLTRPEGLPGNGTVLVKREELPPQAQAQPYGRQCRRTDEATGNTEMSFDVDDRFPYAGRTPLAQDPRNGVWYELEVIFLNRYTAEGADTLALKYKDAQGNLRTEVLRKGPALGERDTWVTYTWVLQDAFFGNQMPGGTDFVLSSNGDGDEFIHRVRVIAHGPGEPLPPGATPPPDARGGTPTPTPQGPSPTLPPPTPTPLPLPPTATPTPLAPTATPTPTPSPTPSDTPTPAPPTPVLAERQNVVLVPGVQGYAGVADTYLNVNIPLSNYGAQQTLAVGCEGSRSRSRALIRFDLGFLPPDRTHVIGARLLLLPVARVAGGEMEVQAYRLLRPWQAAEATWYQAASGVAWGVPGADSAADREARPIARASVGEVYRWVTLDVTDLVREWVRAPEGNYGVLLLCSASGWAEYLFGASERHAQMERPQLQVAYGVIATPTPTVTSTPTWTPSPSPTWTPAPTLTPTPTPLPTKTPTPTAPPTATWTPGPPPPPTKTPTPAPPVPAPPVTREPSPEPTEPPVTLAPPTGTPTSQPPLPTSAPSPTPTPPPSPSRVRPAAFMLVGVLVLLAASGILAWLALGGRGKGQVR